MDASKGAAMLPTTPCLVIDEAVMLHNLERMAQACNTYKCGLRPHIKTHKCPELAKLQLQKGATGITIAKLHEAEIMADAGIEDIFMAYPLVGADKIARAIQLAKRIRFIVAADAYEPAAALSMAAEAAGIKLEMRLELDSGMGRSGAYFEDAVELAQRISALQGIKLTGIFTYRNLMYQGKPDTDCKRCGIDEGNAMVQLAQLMRGAGIDIKDVSVGSTATAEFCARVPGVTEVRPGTYILYDMMQLAKGACDETMLAAHVDVTVVSVKGDLIIVDAGNKSISADCQPDQPPLMLNGYGKVLLHDNITLFAMTEEHGMLRNADKSDGICVGDRLSIVPNHICPTVNLYDNACLIKTDGSVKTLDIAARGANY
ncbi:MAG: alanine racemase [Clostridia bacterium]